MSGFKKEMDFDIDNFGNQKFLKSSESIASILLNLLFMRPGSYPSNPNLGINISSLLYEVTEDIDINALKDKIQSQCSELLPYLLLGEIKVLTNTINGQDVLLVTIDIETDKNHSDTLLYGFTKNKTGETNYNFEIFNKEEIRYE